MKKILTIGVILSILMVSIVYAAPDTKDDFFKGKNKKQIEETISKMSNKPLKEFAKRYDIKEIKGKKLVDDAIVSNKGRPQTFIDRPVGADPLKSENEPSIAAKPNSTSIVVAASHYLYDPPCVSYRSFDGGATWSSPVKLPLLPRVGEVCSDPVIRWSPDSSKVYAAYISFNGTLSDIVVSRSLDNGLTWSTPVSAIAGSSSMFVDKPWIGVHEFWNNGNTSNKLYVTATRFYSNGAMDIAFARSTNGGLSFGSLQAMAYSSGDPVLQGSRPQGGVSSSSTSGDVLVCWYNSESDGWLSGKFDERCRVSTNYGSSFGPETTAVDDKTYEIPYWLGPASKYHRWWTGMFPSIVITSDGVAHMVFTADPDGPDNYGEDGNIYYVKSARPYTSWTPARTSLSTDSWEAQGFPTITAKKTSLGNILIAAWEDHRNSPYIVPPGENCGDTIEYSNGTNCYYDIYSISTSPGGPDWNSNPSKRITDVSSMSDVVFIGDYIDSSTNKIASDTTAQIIWTDRSDKANYLDGEDDVYADRIAVSN